MKETPYELLKDEQKKQLKKNNEAKMTLYNALPQYEKFSILNEETINSGFTRFNAFVTSLKSLDLDYSSKYQVRKFLRALPSKWRAKVTAIKEAKDLATLSLDELISNLKVYETILGSDDVASKHIKEKVIPIALKANITKGQTSNKSTCQDESDEDEEINLMAKTLENYFEKVSRNIRSSTYAKRRLKVARSQDVNAGVIIAENEELLKFSKDFSETYEKLLQEKRALEKQHSKLFSKVNELELEVKKLASNKEVVEPCQKCVKLTQEVDSLKRNVSKLQDETLNFSKFKKSSIVLDDMLSHQKLSQDKEGLGISKNDETTFVNLNKPIVFVKESQRENPSNSFVKPISLNSIYKYSRSPNTHYKKTSLGFS
ncbi:hypothetical protein Tco_0397239 [Tanacetum coccineum]